jgi:hypothetical protein
MHFDTRNLRRRHLSFEGLEDRRLLTGNDTIAEATPVDVVVGNPVTLDGAIDPEGDVDLFEVDLATGQMLTVELFSDVGFVQVFDSDGNNIGFDEDEDGTFVTFDATADFPVFIGVSDFFNTDYDPADASQRFGIDTGDYSLVASISAAQQTELEPNNAIEFASPIVLNTILEANSDDAGDVDFFAITVEESGRLGLNLTTPSVGGARNLRLDLLDANGQIISTHLVAPDNGGMSPLSQHLSPGAYSLKVSSVSGSGAYQIETSFQPATAPFDAIGVSDLSGSVEVVQFNDDNDDGVTNDLDDADLVAVGVSATDINLLSGLGDGTYGLPVNTSLTFPTATNDILYRLGDAAVGNLDGDDIPDLALAVQAFRNVNGNEVGVDGFIAVLLGTSSGGFDFSEDRFFEVGTHPSSIVAADVDGDGHTDVAVANGQDNSVQIWGGDSSGELNLQQTLSTQLSPEALTATDLNGDGRTDLAVANFRSDSATTLTQLASGGFQTAHFQLNSNGSSDVNGPDAIAAGQLNDDNADGVIDNADLVDLVVASLNSNNISVLLGNAQNGFDVQSPTRFNQLSPAESTPGFGSSLVLGQFNDDDVLDLAVTNSTDILLTIATGKGDGSFGVSSTVALDTEADDIAIGDLNGDGRLDVVATQSLSQDDHPASLQVLIGRGDGTVQSSPAEAVGPSPLAIVSLDANSDGIPDLVTANNFDASFSVLLGLGDGTYQPGIRQKTGLRPVSVVTGDFNDDGRPDLAVASLGEISGSSLFADDFVNVHLGRGDGTFRLADQFAAGSAPTDMAIAQLNDDDGNGIIDDRDREDIVVTSLFSAQLSVLLGTTGDQLFETGNDAPTVGARPTQVVATDLNRDGITDLAVLSEAGTEAFGGSQDISLLLGNGDGTFQPRTVVPQSSLNGDPRRFDLADANGDGLLDLLVVVETQDALVPDDLEPNDTLASATEVTLSSVEGTTISSTIAPSGDVDLYKLALDSGQTLKINVVPGGQLGSAVRIFGEDGSFQTISFSEETEFIAPFDGTYFVGISARTNLGYNPIDGTGTTVFPGDTSRGSYAVSFSLDGVQAPSNSGNGQTNLPGGANVVKVFVGDGMGSFQTNGTPITDAEGADLLVNGQFNDDNNDGVIDDRDVTDLAIARSSSVWVLLGPGLTGLSHFPTRSGVSDLIVLDANGDGFADVATANGGSDTVSVLLGTGDGQLVSPDRLPAQLSGAEPIFADLNQDGTDDVVILNRAGEIILRTGRVIASGEEPGTFDPPVILNPNAPATAIAFAQTGTGPSVAAINRNSDSVSLYRLDNLDAPVTLATAAGPTRMAVGDLNDDGRDDIAVAMAGSGVVQVFDGRADGSFDVEGSTELGTDASHPAQNAPSDFLIEDTNGDDLLDLLVADRTAATVTIFENEGNGVFSHSGRFAVGSGPSVVQPAADDGFQRVTRDETSAIVTGHFNEDALLDIAVANRGSNTVTIHLGIAGGFIEHTTLAVGSDPSAIRVGFIDNDDQLDLAVLNEGGDDISLFLGRPQGLFELAPVSESQIRYDAGNRPTGLTLQDVDQDGLVDLVLGNEFGDVMTLQQNADAGGDSDKPLFQAFTRADRKVALAVDDINGDGISDWVVTNESNDRLGIEFGQPDGAVASDADRADRFSEISSRSDGVVAPASAKTVQLNDDNQDGTIDDNDLLDLVVANSGANNVLVYMGQAPSASAGGQPRAADFFATSAMTLFAGTEPVGLTIGDANLDALPDVIVTNRGSNDISVLLGDTDEMLLPGVRLDVINPDSLTATTAPVSTEIGMFNDDQIPDLLVVAPGTDQALLIPGVGNGFFNETAAIAFDTGAGSSPTGIILLPTGGFVSINSGTDSLRQFNSFGLGSSFTDVRVGSLPTAGLLSPFSSGIGFDLFIANAGDGSISILAAGANGSLSLLDTFISGELQHPTAMALADLGSGNDFALLVADEGDDLVSVFNRTELGQPVPIEAFASSAGNSTAITTVITVLAALFIEFPGDGGPEVSGERTMDIDGSGTPVVKLIAGLLEAFNDVLAVGWSVLDATLDQLGELIQPGSSEAIFGAVQDALRLVLPFSPLDVFGSLGDIFGKSDDEETEASGTADSGEDEEKDDSASTPTENDDRQANRTALENLVWRNWSKWYAAIDDLVSTPKGQASRLVGETTGPSPILEEMAEKDLPVSRSNGDRRQRTRQPEDRKSGNHDKVNNDDHRVVDAAFLSLISTGWVQAKRPAAGHQSNTKGDRHGSYS